MNKLLAFAAAVTFAAPAMAADLRLDLLGRVDVSTSGIGNNPASVGWNGLDLYVGGVNNGSSNVAIARIADALGTATVTTFGATTAGATAGYEYMDVNGNDVFVSFTGTESAQAYDGLSGSLYPTFGTNNSQSGSLEGIAYDRRFSGLADTVRRGRGFVFRERLDGSTSNVGLSLPSGTFGYRGIDVDFNGNLFIRSDNGAVRVPTSTGDANGTVYDSAGTVALGGSGGFAQYRNIVGLDNTGFGDFVLFNERGTNISFLNSMQLTDYAGNSLTLALNLGGDTILDSLTGAYDFSYDRVTNTLAVSDFSNREVYIFGVVPTPGAAGILGIAGLAALRRRR